MIGYVTLGTNDLDSGAAFYDSVLAEIGAKRFSTTDRMVVYGVQPDAPMLMLCTPFDKQEAARTDRRLLRLLQGSRWQQARGVHYGRVTR